MKYRLRASSRASGRKARAGNRYSGKARNMRPDPRTCAACSRNAARRDRNVATLRRACLRTTEDRKSVVEGQGVSVRVELGGRRIIKKEKTISKKKNYRQQ